MTVSRRNLLKGLAVTGAALAAPATAEARERKVAPADAVGMLYDSTLCVGCRACVVKCKEEGGLPPDTAQMAGAPYDAPADLSATARTVIKRGGEGTGGAFVKVQCMHCVDPACVSACMLGALNKRERGAVTWQKERCVGCRYCQIACPFNVPKFQWDSPTPEIVKCDLCVKRVGEGRAPACAEVCPRQAILFGPLEQLKAEAHRRIEASPGRYQPRVYGENEAGGTQVLYLSAVPFEQLGLPRVGDRPAPEQAETVQHSLYQGFIAPAVLYGAVVVATLRNTRHEREEEKK